MSDVKQVREYQIRAHGELHALWNSGARSVVLVSPTGSGKTHMLMEQIRDVLAQGERALWLTHTRDLVEQSAKELADAFGRDAVGIIMAGHAPNAHRAVQVASIQTMIERDMGLDVDLVVFDECHHTEAATYRRLLGALRWRRLLGGTATPERRDGKPLGDTFDHLVVAANYTELIKGEYLVPAHVLRPPTYLGSDLAEDPVTDTARYCRGQRTFLFARRVEEAYEYAKRLRALRFRAEAIDAETDKLERVDRLAAFKRGDLDVLANVYLLTEGVNVPEASAEVLARAFTFAGNMIQATGRVLRPCEGKTRGLIVDLAGCTHRHGWPDSDREFSLTGRAIKSKDDREVAERGDPLDPKILGIGLQLESRWDADRDVQSKLSVAAAEQPVPMPAETAAWLEKARQRARARRRSGIGRAGDVEVLGPLRRL